MTNQIDCRQSRRVNGPLQGNAATNRTAILDAHVSHRTLTRDYNQIASFDPRRIICRRDGRYWDLNAEFRKPFLDQAMPCHRHVIMPVPAYECAPRIVHSSCLQKFVSFLYRDEGEAELVWISTGALFLL
jgi:hypothetical protein